MDSLEHIENEFASDEEAEKALDGLLDGIGGAILRDESRTAVTTPGTMRSLITVYRAAKKMVGGRGVKVLYELHEPFNSMGSVTIEGKNAVFRHPVFLGKAAKLASNFEAYPLTNGRVRLTFTFHNLTLPIEEG